MTAKIKLIITALAISCHIVGWAQPDYYVSTTGNDANSGTLPAPFATIQHAINQAVAGSTVYILQGTYYEHLWIGSNSGNAGNPITIRNYNNDVVIVDGGGTSAGVGDAICALTNVDYIVIDGLRFQNIINHYVKGLVIFENCNHITINNCKFTDVHFSNNPMDIPNAPEHNVNPLIVYSTSATHPVTNVIFSNNEVSNCRTGFSESMTINGNTDGFTIENNYIHDVTNIGIDAAGHFGACPDPVFDQSRNGVIRNNILHDCVTPAGVDVAGSIYVDGGKNIIVENNIVYNGEIGISIGCENVGKTADNITVRNNICYNNQRTGIEIGGWNYPGVSGKVINSALYGNTCYKNDTGDQWAGELLITYNDNLTVKNNILYSDNANNVIYNYRTVNGVGIFFNYNLFYAPSGSNNATFDGLNAYTFSDYQSMTGWGANSQFIDPQFVDASMADFHLQSSSPAINKGDPTYVAAAGEVDMDTEPRTNGVVDCGADEFHAPLATGLQTFKAIVLNNKSVQINWQTTSQNNISRYIIERSDNGDNWDFLATVQDKEQIHYQTFDNYPLPGKSYYRLKMLDFSNNIEYSNIQAIELHQSFEYLLVFPNPAGNQIDIQSFKYPISNFRIFNTYGQDVCDLVKIIIQEDNLLKLDISNLPQGTYFLQSNAGHQKIFKQ